MSGNVNPTNANPSSVSFPNADSNNVDPRTKRLQQRTRFLLHVVLLGLVVATSLVLMTGLDHKLNAGTDSTSTTNEFTGRWELAGQFLELKPDGQVVGYDGCNDLRAQWTQLGENEVSFSPFSSTKRACGDSEGEQLLGEATKASLDSTGDSLQVYGLQGEVLTTLSSAPVEQY